MAVDQAGFPHAPIVEAVVDIDCDMPPNFDITALQADAQRALINTYPIFEPVFIEELRPSKPHEAPFVHSQATAIYALQFFQADRKQLLQFRRHGLSFNRLAPYSSFDEYLDAIKAGWQLFTALARPIQVQEVRLRYINRLLLPTQNGKWNLSKYLDIGPGMPPGINLEPIGFLVQHSAVEAVTGNLANIVLASQPLEQGRLPLILDIGVAKNGAIQFDDWKSINEALASLRNLKNNIFYNTLTQSGRDLFK